MKSVLIIRLARRGHKRYPIYNIVVSLSFKRSRGFSFERLGFFNPHAQERQLYIKGNRLAFWLNRGAKLHRSVIRLLATMAV